MGASVPCLDGGRPAAVRESTSSPAMVLASLVAWRGAAGGRSGGRWLVRRKGAGLPPVGRWAERALATAPRRRDARRGLGGGSALVVKHVLCIRTCNPFPFRTRHRRSVCVWAMCMSYDSLFGRVLTLVMCVTHMWGLFSYRAAPRARPRIGKNVTPYLRSGMHSPRSNLAAETPSLKNKCASRRAFRPARKAP